MAARFHHQGTKHRGLTLVELMIALAVLGIMLTIGVPAFTETVRQNRITAQTNTTVGLLNFARSEAVKRRANIEVEFTAEGSGWKAQVRPAGANDVLRELRYPQGHTNFGEVGETDLPTVTFNSLGRLNANQDMNLFLQHSPCEGKQRRVIELFMMGTARIAENNGSPRQDCA